MRTIKPKFDKDHRNGMKEKAGYFSGNAVTTLLLYFETGDGLKTPAHS